MKSIQIINPKEQWRCAEEMVNEQRNGQVNTFNLLHICITLFLVQFESGAEQFQTRKGKEGLTWKSVKRISLTIKVERIRRAARMSRLKIRKNGKCVG